MIGFDQHRSIAALLSEWSALSTLFEKIQMKNGLTVQVNGSYYDKFQPAALAEAKKILKADGERIKADLKQLDFDISCLTPLEDYTS